MANFIEKLKTFKYWKDVAITAVSVTFGLLAVLGQVFSENAKTPVGWTIWDVLTVVGVAGFVGGIIYLAVRDRSQK